MLLRVANSFLPRCLARNLSCSSNFLVSTCHNSREYFWVNEIGRIVFTTDGYWLWFCILDFQKPSVYGSFHCILPICCISWMLFFWLNYHVRCTFEGWVATFERDVAWIWVRVMFADLALSLQSRPLYRITCKRFCAFGPWWHLAHSDIQGRKWRKCCEELSKSYVGNKGNDLEITTA